MSDNDQNTGLPQLPEGWFYRIKKWNYHLSECTLMVEVREPRRFGSRLLGQSIARHTDRGVWQGAEFALQDAQRKARSRRTISARNQYLGDYPPKKLGGLA